MRITQRQLRQIIREELARDMNEMDLQLAVPYIARQRKKQKPAPPQEPLGPMPDHMRKAESRRTELNIALELLAKDLSKIDADYVQDILPSAGLSAPYTHIIDWAGPELREKIEELALDYLKLPGVGWGRPAPDADIEATFKKFQEIVNQYAPIRGRQDFLGTASRFASGFGVSTGLTPLTKESFKRR